MGSIGRQLRDCEEACCDAAVVAHRPHARREYAKLLLDVLDFASPLPGKVVPQATAMSAAQGLEQRLRAILNATHGTPRRWPAAAIAVCLAFAIVPCGLQYDWSSRPASAATLTAPALVTPEACLPGDPPKVDRSLTLCCPS
jgi:beta-lactamase regulating signal transducer with metallopeptidase domain